MDALIKQIIDNVDTGVYIIDKKTKKIIMSNKSMERLAGMKIVGKYCYELLYSGDDTSESDNISYLNKHSSYRQLCVPEKNAWYAIKNNSIKWFDGRLVSLCTVTDITDKKHVEKGNTESNGSMICLFNRMKCEKDLTEAIKKAVSYGESGMVLVIDLDNFEEINQEKGVVIADKLLEKILESLKSIRGIENYCYRMGGDEFMVIIDPDYMYKSSEIIGSIYQRFRKPWHIENKDCFCTMSMGVVYYPDDGGSVGELMKKGGIAVYDAKSGGKNRIEYYNSQKDLMRRMDMEKNMRLAIMEGCDEFKLYIQPIMDATSKKCIGGEALIRWDNGNLGFIAPSEFIPLAENLGLINQIGDYFMEFACIINKSWSDKGIDAKINVNLSIVQLMQNNIVEKISEIIKKTNAKPQNIVFEITESIALKDIGRMQKIIGRLKNLGVGIALDDFGTGHSSLNFINQMDFDIIKIDKSFVDDIETKESSKTFIKMVADISEEIGAKVCIEGVETKKQVEILEDMNIHMIQGYYYGKPMMYDDFEREFLENKLDNRKNIY